MIVFPQAYAAAALSTRRRGRRVIAIEFDSGDVAYFTSHTGIPNIPAGAYESTVKNVSGRSASLDRENGRSTIGRFSFSLIDVDQNISTLFAQKEAAGKGLTEKVVRLYHGYDGLDWSDFQNLETYQIYTAEVTGGLYKIQCKDVKRIFQQKIMEPKETTLAATITDSDTTIQVADTSEFSTVFHGPSYTDAPNATVGYIKIGDEIIRYTGKTSTTFTGCTRGVFGTFPAAAEYDSGASQARQRKVTEVIYLELPVPKLIYAVMTGELHGDSAQLPDHWHMAVPTSLVNLASFQAIGADLWDPSDDSAGFSARFLITESQDGKEFIEQECQRLISCFGRVEGDGRYALRRLANLAQNAPFQAVLTEANVSRFGRLIHASDMRINNFRVYWNKVGDEFTRANVFIDADSISTHGESVPKELEFQGLFGSRATAPLVDQLMQGIADAVAWPPQKLTVEVLGSLSRLEIGDVVRVQARVRDYKNALTLRLDRSFEITRRQRDYESGKIKLDLFGSTNPATLNPFTADTEVLPDGFYSSEGTELSTVLTIVGGVVQAGTYTLTGTADATAAGSIFYYDGDLEIASGATINLVGNVQIRVRGFLQINGEINGVGGGQAGVADDTNLLSSIEGMPGYVGATACGPGIWELGEEASTIAAIVTEGEHTVFPYLTLQVDASGSGAISGVPTDLRGTSGGPGRKARVGFVDFEEGGTGGDSGAGLVIVCRGGAVGASGTIDLSGTDGAAPSVFLNDGFRVFPGSGGGGGPGACLVLIDGNAAFPNFAQGFTALTGATPVQGNPLPEPDGNHGPTLNLQDPGMSGYLDPGSYISEADYSGACIRLQYLPADEDPEEDPTDPPEVGASLVLSLSNEAQTLAADNSGNVGSFATANGLAKLLLGLQDITSLATFSVVEQTGCTGTVNTAVDTPVAGQPKGYYRVTAMSADTARLVIRAEYSGLQLDRVFSLSKSKEGSSGTGESAKIVTLEATDQFFRFNGSGNLIGPAKITFTADRQNISTAITWSSVPAGLLSSISGDTAELTSGDFGSEDTVLVRAEADGQSDQITVHRVQDGSDGADGTLEEFVFRRATVQPATPTGDGVPAGWSDEPPGGIGALWMSRAVQQLDGTTVGSWSTPRRMDGSGGSSALNIGRRMNVLDEWFRSSDQSLALSGYTDVAAVALSGPVWSSAFDIVNPSSTRQIWSEKLTIDPAKRHRVSIWARQPVGTIGNYLAVTFYDDTGARIPGSGSGASGWTSKGTHHYWLVANSAFPTDWTRYQFEFGGGASAEIPAGAVAVAIGVLGTYQATGGSAQVQLQDYFVVEVPEDAESIYTATIFRRSATAPATPTGGSYDFGTKTLTPPSGWSINPPATNGNPLYVSQASFSIQGISGVDSSATWTSPQVLVVDGEDGADGTDGAPGSDGTDGTDGLSVYTATIFRRSATAPATPTDGSYDFGTRTLTPPSGWSENPPAWNGQTLYACRGSFSIQGISGVDSSTSWSAPEIVVVDGNSLDIIFRRSVAQPATPAPSAGTPSGWYTDISAVPAGAGSIWSAIGTRAAGATNYTWQTPVKLEANVEGELVADPLVTDSGAWDTSGSGVSWQSTAGADGEPAIRVATSSVATSFWAAFSQVTELPPWIDGGVLRFQFRARGDFSDGTNVVSMTPYVRLYDAQGDLMETYTALATGDGAVTGDDWRTFVATIVLDENELAGSYGAGEPLPWYIQIGINVAKNASGPVAWVDRLSVRYEAGLFDGSDDNKVGLVPARKAAAAGKLLKDDGSWSDEVPTLKIGNADTALSRKGAGDLAVANRAALVHQSTGYSSGRLTVSTGNPSGGSNGDVWLKYS